VAVVFRDAISSRSASNSVERTYSEYKASLYETIRVQNYPSLPADLKAGVLEDVYLAATAGVPSADFQDGTPRFYTCQSCHMQPAIGKGAKQPYAPVRRDIGTHDLTGGSIWVHEATKWLDDQNKLVMGGGLSTATRAAMDVGEVRARELLRSAATVSVVGDTARVTNLTGHKLISGYPEGRRMWLHVRWLGPGGELVREDGAFGPISVNHKGQALVVDSLLDPHDPELRNYHVTMGLRQDWAAKLLTAGVSPNLALEYDRLDGSVLHTLGQLAAQPAGTVWESAHFILNDQVLHDTRIPPYGMDFDESLKRGILPVPAALYGDPGPGGTYEHFDEFALDPPVGAATAELELLYQSASWEYVQFLDLAGDGSVAFLANTGKDLVDAWLATGQSAPEWMAGTTWVASPGDCDHDGLQDSAEIAAGTEVDCNGNGVLDTCEIAVDTAADLDFDGGLDVCQWLSADVAGVSLATGGTQQLSLHAGSARAGDFYLTLGSVSGVSPGIPVGAFTLPLGVDSYFLFTLTNANSPVLQSSFGSLDGNGAGGTAIWVPPGLSPALAGVVGWHAFVSLDGTSLVPTGVSNPVSVTLQP
ncbi:MAG: hypothetical protein H8D72_00110, partial [Planctomycetes bacterium]|nr:hypothetical protein [Planctomycetota bacterium]